MPDDPTPDLVDCYITAEDMAAWIGASTLADDSTLRAAINAASRAIDNYCGRDFIVPVIEDEDPGEPSVRYYHGGTQWVPIDDVATLDDLLVETDDDDDGTYSTEWTVLTDYVIEPANNLPGQALLSVGDRAWPQKRRPGVKVTAFYGWPAVPEPVRQSCLILTAAIWKRKDAPLGVAGFNDFGELRIGSDVYAQAVSLLEFYRRPRSLLGL